MSSMFDEVIDRHHTNSYKWDVAQGELPMWVADMDFRTAPAVLTAIAQKLQTGVLGYQIVPDAWYEAIMSWWSRRYGLALQKDWLQFTTGVVPAITCAVKRLTSVGDNVVVQTPAYDIFYHSVENTGRHVLENPLRYENGRYLMDFADLEEKLSHPYTTMMILCNPHNPVGRIWTREELSRVADLCHRHGVVLLSDEIHCDLTAPGVSYVPFLSVSKENAVMCLSPGKSFNMAGVNAAAVAVPDVHLRERLVRALNSDEVAEPNAFAVEATIAAYRESEAWLEELRAYLHENKQLAKEMLQKELPQVLPIDQNATYLLWVDCSAVCADTEPLCAFIRKQTGLFVTAGGQYRGNGACFVRINLACPRAVAKDGIQRFITGVKAYLKHQ